MTGSNSASKRQGRGGKGSRARRSAKRLEDAVRRAGNGAGAERLEVVSAGNGAVPVPVYAGARAGYGAPIGVRVATLKAGPVGGRAGQRTAAVTMPRTHVVRVDGADYFFVPALGGFFAISGVTPGRADDSVVRTDCVSCSVTFRVFPATAATCIAEGYPYPARCQQCGRAKRRNWAARELQRRVRGRIQRTKLAKGVAAAGVDGAVGSSHVNGELCVSAAGMAAGLLQRYVRGALLRRRLQALSAASCIVQRHARGSLQRWRDAARMSARGTAGDGATSEEGASVAAADSAVGVLQRSLQRWRDAARTSARDTAGDFAGEEVASFAAADSTVGVLQRYMRGALLRWRIQALSAAACKVQRHTRGFLQRLRDAARESALVDLYRRAKVLALRRDRKLQKASVREAARSATAVNVLRLALLSVDEDRRVTNGPESAGVIAEALRHSGDAASALADLVGVGAVISADAAVDVCRMAAVAHQTGGGLPPESPASAQALMAIATAGVDGPLAARVFAALFVGSQGVQASVQLALRDARARLVGRLTRPTRRVRLENRAVMQRVYPRAPPVWLNAVRLQGDDNRLSMKVHLDLSGGGQWGVWRVLERKVESPVPSEEGDSSGDDTWGPVGSYSDASLDDGANGDDRSIDGCISSNLGGDSLSVPRPAAAVHAVAGVGGGYMADDAAAAESSASRVSLADDVHVAGVDAVCQVSSDMLSARTVEGRCADVYAAVFNGRAQAQAYYFDHEVTAAALQADSFLHRGCRLSVHEVNRRMLQLDASEPVGVPPVWRQKPDKGLATCCCGEIVEAETLASFHDDWLVEKEREGWWKPEGDWRVGVVDGHDA